MSISTPEAARAVSAKATAGKLTLQLEDGRTLSVPLKLFPRLRDATPAKLADLRLVARGIGIHWPQLDEDLSVRGLLTAEPLPEPPIRITIIPGRETDEELDPGEEVPNIEVEVGTEPR
mgnify:CR=1 FL=1